MTLAMFFRFREPAPAAYVERLGRKFFVFVSHMLALNIVRALLLPGKLQVAF